MWVWLMTIWADFNGWNDNDVVHKPIFTAPPVLVVVRILLHVFSVLGFTTKRVYLVWFLPHQELFVLPTKVGHYSKEQKLLESQFME